MEWSVVYEKAIRDDGSLLFPERLTKDFLEQQRRVMGSMFFANQYQNEIISDEDRKFRPEWLRRWTELPQEKYTFAFLDPAIGQKDHNDYTALAVIDVDVNGAWYLKVANRYRLTPTEIVEKVFQVQAEFNCQCIGVESVAYQEALLYMLDEEMKRRQKVIPVKGITRTKTSKEARIYGLVPRFEWGRLFLPRGTEDLEDEYLSFPRGKHDDILDAIASLEEIVFYPSKKEKHFERPPNPSGPRYEHWVLEQYKTRGSLPDSEESYD